MTRTLIVITIVTTIITLAISMFASAVPAPPMDKAPFAQGASVPDFANPGA